MDEEEAAVCDGHFSWAWIPAREPGADESAPSPNPNSSPANAAYSLPLDMTVGTNHQAREQNPLPLGGQNTVER